MTLQSPTSCLPGVFQLSLLAKSPCGEPQPLARDPPAAAHHGGGRKTQMANSGPLLPAFLGVPKTLLPNVLSFRLWSGLLKTSPNAPPGSCAFSFLPVSPRDLLKSLVLASGALGLFSRHSLKGFPLKPNLLLG